MEKANSVKKIFLMVLCVVLVGIIIALGFEFKNVKNWSTAGTQDNEYQGRVGEKLFDNTSVVKEEVVTNTQVIEDGLRKMGVLVTEEYYFTQVEEYKSTKEFLSFFGSTAILSYSYDGVVNAGIDCEKIIVTKDDENKAITISIPKAEIFDVDIDYNSFKVLKEENGIWNKIDMSKMNDSLIKFEESAKNKALEKGILSKANEGAGKMIQSFVNSLVDANEYKIEYVEQ